MCYGPSGRGHKGSKRVNRGGSWINHARNVRSAYRNGIHPGNRNDDQGFRLAREQLRVGLPAADPTVVLSCCYGSGRRPSGRRCAGRRDGRPADGSSAFVFFPAEGGGQ